MRDRGTKPSPNKEEAKDGRGVAPPNMADWIHLCSVQLWRFEAGR